MRWGCQNVGCGTWGGAEVLWVSGVWSGAVFGKRDVACRLGSGGTSVKVAGFFYEIGRKRSGIIHTTLLAEG